MKAFLLGCLFTIGLLTKAFAYGAIACQMQDGKVIDCDYEENVQTEDEAKASALDICNDIKSSNEFCVAGGTIHNTCYAAFLSREGILSSIKDTHVEVARSLAQAQCKQFSVFCQELFTFCDPAPTTTATQNASGAKAAEGISAFFDALMWLNRYMWAGAFAGNVILFSLLFRFIKSHSERASIVGTLTAVALLGATTLPNNPWPFQNVYFGIAVVGLQRTCAIGILAAGLPFVYFVVVSLFDSGLPGNMPTASQHIEVLIQRSQRRSLFKRVIFIVDARMGVSVEQLELMRKYRLGRTIVFDSARRERQNELARTHFEMAREKASRPICLWREEVRGLLRRLYYLIRSLVSFLLGFLFVRVTLGKLIKGAHVESKSLETIMAAKHAMERAAGDLKVYLEVAESFDGREDLFEPA